MAMLVTEYSIHVGQVLSLSLVFPGREEVPVVIASLHVPFLPVVTGQILNANWHSLQECIIYEEHARNWKDSYNQYQHKQNIQPSISATECGCPCLVITPNTFFTFLNCNSFSFSLSLFRLRIFFFRLGGFSKERGMDWKNKIENVYKYTYLAKTRSTLLNIAEGGGDVKSDVGFLHKTAPYWKWKWQEARQAKQPFTDKRGEEVQAGMYQS